MMGYGKRVLIVEHDEGERYVLSLLLENERYSVHMVSEEGLDFRLCRFACMY